MNTDNKIYLKELKLTNFRQFEELTLPIHPQLTVILGENGGGKTSICDALGKLKKIASERLLASDMKLGAKYCEIKCSNTEGDIDLWTFGEDNKNNNVGVNPDIYFLYLSLQSMPEYFKQFQNLFINQTNYENQQRIETDINYRLSELIIMQTLLVDFFKALGEYKYHTLRVKTNLRTASATFWPQSEFDKYKIMQPEHSIQIAKNKQFIDIDLLSQGELQLLKLVLNIFVEQLRWDSPFDNKVPIVVIDEIDLHLHPRWQRNLLPALMKVFPEVQFIVTTHSPLIVSNIKAEHIVLLKDYKAYPLKNPTEGRDVNSILYEVFGVTKRPEKAAKMIEACGKAIEKATDDDNWAEAKAKLDELRELFGDTDIDVVRLQAAYDFYN